VSYVILDAPRTLSDLIPRPNARAQRLVRDVALVCGFAVLTAVLAQVRIDLTFTPVPITGQTLGVLLSGAVLGANRGGLAQLAYWMLGIFAPVPWFAGDHSGTSITAGWHIATGSTAGYLAGFVIAAYVVGRLAQQGQDRRFSTSVPAMLTGTAIIYVCGIVWLSHSLHVPIATGHPNGVEYGLTPFLAGDMVKLVLAGAITPAAWRLFDR
jgi:biotin transport system substrate-specific component